MARTYSQMPALGTTPYAFDLSIVNPEVDALNGPTRRLEDYADTPVLVIVFTCNHCPFAIHVEDELIRIAHDYAGRGVQLVAISANDPAHYPADGPEAMAARAQAKQYPFPYLFDETQEVAKRYAAACTPDLYVFDQDRRLAYRGRIDETRPGMGAAHGADLRGALDELLGGGTVTRAQHPALGCNIKWRPGNAPAYFPAY